MSNIDDKRYAPAVAAIDALLAGTKSPILVAIDGRTGAGKTTIAKYLKKHYSCNLFHMDDFYLQSHQRTTARLREIGGNVDYERFYDEVLCPLLRGESVDYRPFNYLTMDFDRAFARTIPPKRLNLIEGTYAMNPYFHDPYDLHIFMDVAHDRQIQNVIDRQGTAELDDYIDKWIPKTDVYIDRFGIEEKCEVKIAFPAEG